jgi:hypothetical protein
MSDEHDNESQAIVRELERLHKSVRRFNVVLITVVSFALAALVLGLLFASVR